MGSLNKKIAIIGATGHIAKSLIDSFCRTNQHELFLFARSLERLSIFLASINFSSASPRSFSEFAHEEYDVIINCVGIGDPGKLKSAGISIFKVTEIYDNLVLDYLETHPATLYLNFSSGAAFGTDFSAPIKNSTCAKWSINQIASNDFYGIAKLNSEAKHRALANLHIVDLRVFGYFSRFIDLESQYLINEIINSIRDSKEFVTGAHNIVRDYVHPKDLFSLIDKCIAKSTLNGVFDVYSLKPVTKFEILDYFAAEHGLKYVVKDNVNISAATGIKDRYYSDNKNAREVGYIPRFTSLDSIIQEASVLLVS